MCNLPLWQEISIKQGSFIKLLDLEINSEDQRELIDNCHLAEGGTSNASQFWGLRRRGRKMKDRQDQQSICGCGNVYSCSSALSLHIKNKHGGQVPKGSVGYPRRRERKNDGMHNTVQQTIISNGLDQSQHTNQHQAQNMPNSNEPPYIQHQHDNINEQSKSHATFDEHLTSYPEDDQIQQSQSKYRKKYRCGIREYVSKRIYLCGCCLSGFGFLEELMLHIKQKHEGEIPDGSIFGLKREVLLGLFHIAAPRANPNRKFYIFRCGCGKEYSCSSSLYYHIKTVHNGSEPLGTFGARRR